MTPGEMESLTELLQWLVKQKAWKAVDDLAQRFAAQAIGDPSLLYLLAEAYDEQGLKERMQETAARAFGLNPGKDEQHLVATSERGGQSGGRGSIRFGTAGVRSRHRRGQSERQQLPATAQSRLAVMLHDQGQDLDAAETLEKMLQSWEKVKADRRPARRGQIDG